MERLAEWSDARTAALFLRPCTPRYLNEELGTMLRRESANRPGTRYATSGGWRYHRDDLERVRAIMDALGCAAFAATRHLHAMRTLSDRKLLEWLLEHELRKTLERDAAQIDIDEKLKRKRRRQ